jgi:hypothetical protein
MLSRAKGVQRVLELKEKIAILLEENYNDHANIFRGNILLLNLAI